MNGDWKDLLLQDIIFKDGRLAVVDNKKEPLYIQDFGTFFELCLKVYYPHAAISTKNRLKIERAFHILTKLVESSRMKQLKLIEFITLVHEIAGIL